MDGSLSLTFARWRSSGNPRLLAEVFDRASPELLRVAIHLVGEVGAAEDLVQATFLTAIERAKGFDESRRLEPWLAGILENHAHELARLAARSPDPELLEQRLERTPLDEALSRELSAEIAAAIDRLPEPYRRTLLLRVRHGLAPADIAHVLGESPGTVRVRLHRALELLRKELPSGLALGALFALEPARGMSAVKGAVLAAGAGGVLVMKKVLLAAAALALLLLAWWKWPVPTPNVVANKPESAPAQLAVETAAGQKPEELSIASAAGTARVAAEPVGSQPEFHFRGQVVDGETSEPLAEASVALYPAQSLTLSEVKRRYHAILDWNWDPEWAPLSGWPIVTDPVTAAQRADRTPLRVSVPPESEEGALGLTVTKADGAFDFTARHPDGFFVCRRAGYADRLLPVRRSVTRYSNKDGRGVEETSAIDSVIVRMFREYEIHGHLIDEQGERVHESVGLRFDGYSMSNDMKAPPIDDPLQLGHWVIVTESDGTFRLRVAAPFVNVDDNDSRWSLCQEGMHPVLHERWGFDYCFTLEKSAEDFYVVVRRTPIMQVRDRETHEPVESFTLVARAGRNGEPLRSGHFFAPKGELPLIERHGLWARVLPGEHQQVSYTVWAKGYASSTVSAVLERRGPDLAVELARGELPLSKGELRRKDIGLPGVEISIAPEASSSWEEGERNVLASSMTDAAGRFSFQVPDGFHVLRFRVDGVARSKGVLIPAAQPIVIDVSSDASITVHVRNANGRPCTAHAVFLQPNGGAQRQCLTDERGDAVFEGLASGTTRVQLFYDNDVQAGAVDYSSAIELAEGQRAGLEIVIPPDDPRFPKLAVSGEQDHSAWRARVAHSAQDWVAVEASGRVPIDIQRSVNGLEFDRGGAQRWYFSLPKEPPADLVLRINPGGPAYDVELVDGAQQRPLAGAVVMAYPQHGTREGEPLVSAMSDDQGVAHLVNVAFGTPVLLVRLHGFEPYERDLLAWNGSMGAFGFEPQRAAASPATRVRIEVPKSDGETFRDFPVVRVRGVVRIGGAPRKNAFVQAFALVPQAEGTLQLHAVGSSGNADAEGHYDLRVPRSGLVHFGVYDNESNRSLPPLEWILDQVQDDQQHDLDFP